MQVAECFQGGAPDVGAHHARSLRGRREALDDVPLPAPRKRGRDHRGRREAGGGALPGGGGGEGASPRLFWYDEGNAWGRLAAALNEMGEDEQAKEAYRRGIEAANRHGHPTMAEELVLMR
mgnify:CR=1 FL=1